MICRSLCSTWEIAPGGDIYFIVVRHNILVQHNVPHSINRRFRAWLVWYQKLACHLVIGWLPTFVADLTKIINFWQHLILPTVDIKPILISSGQIVKFSVFRYHVFLTKSSFQAYCIACMLPFHLNFSQRWHYTVVSILDQPAEHTQQSKMFAPILCTIEWKRDKICTIDSMKG